MVRGGCAFASSLYFCASRTLDCDVVGLSLPQLWFYTLDEWGYSTYRRMCHTVVAPTYRRTRYDRGTAVAPTDGSATIGVLY